METPLNNAMADNFRRLATFQETPLPSTGDRSHASLLRYNSPLKLSNAGFYREHDAHDDEVKCFRCSLVFRGWNGESPMSVHRILSPGCLFIQNTKTPTCLTASPSSSAMLHVRRRLDLVPPTSPEATADLADTNNVSSPQQSLLDIYDRIQTPTNSTELSSSYDDSGLMLFEGQRLKTFPSPTHPRAEEWASAGFVFKEGDVVRCVFCGVEMQYNSEQPSKLHREQSEDCPIVRYLDVGNIPLELETRIRSKYAEQSGEDTGVCNDPVFKHPQFEDREERHKTFVSWPRWRISTSCTPELLCAAGFYYSGYTDKVVCFACGYSLYNWDREADPWTQHSRHSPQCVYVSLEKGDNFVREAEDVEILTTCDPPSDNGNGSHDNAHLRPSLDMSAIKAALACQYDIHQIRRAVLKFFLLTSGSYPNEALLLGSLRASDANFSHLQRQRQQLHNKDLSLLLFTDQLQQRDEELQQRDEELERSQEEHQTDLERLKSLERLELENRTLVNRLHGQRDVIQRHTQQLQTTYIQLQDKENQLGNQNSELERKQRELERQFEENKGQSMRHAEEKMRQAEENRRQAEKIERLTQLLLANNIHAPDEIQNNPAPAAPANTSPTYSPMDSRCKVCLEEEARCLFRPCRHMCCGIQCAPRFIGKNCPICRDNVQDWEVIFVA